MYQTKKIYVRPNMKMADLVIDNPLLLLMLEHFRIDFAVQDKTVSVICKENQIELSLFLSICNLYNGFIPDHTTPGKGEISSIIRFLKNSHSFYQEDKYPEIRSYISLLHQHCQQEEVKLIEAFFDDYFEEVIEHLNYEDQVAFPYFCALSSKENMDVDHPFSVKEYADHHSDIETKLSDLKNLLLKHIQLRDHLSLRRKLIFSLFELEYDLKIHSAIEEHILVPLVELLEKGMRHE